MSKNCLIKKGFYPSFKPVVYSVSNINNTIYVNGFNFLHSSQGTTSIKMNEFSNMPISFYSSTNISFVSPFSIDNTNISKKITISVTNVYNGNFSPSINTSEMGQCIVSDIFECYFTL